MFSLKSVSFLIFVTFTLANAITGYAGTSLPDIKELDYGDPLASSFNDYSSRDLILSWQARRALRKILAQMPCGWTEYNIPPLAPYIAENVTLNYNSNITKLHTHFETLRIDGLDVVDINKLSVSYFLKRVDFNISFPNITLTGKFNTSVYIDMLQAAGFDFKLDANGLMNLTLENVNLRGLLRYKLPLFSGTAKVTLFKPQLSVENVHSSFTGYVNSVPIGKRLNELTSKGVLYGINQKQLYWSTLMEDRLVPLANEHLEGKSLWKIFLWALNQDNTITCPSANVANMEQEELMELLQRLDA